MPHDGAPGARPTRRALLRTGAALAAAGTLGVRAGPAARAHNLPPGQFGSPAYDAALAATGGMKGVFQSPHVEASVVAGKDLNHLLLVQLRNWLNGFQFSYEMAPAELHTIVATYASANLLTYNDTVWAKYKFGEKYAVTDPATGAPAGRNVFRPSRFGPDAPKDPAASDGFYQDTGIEALQQRGAVFLTWHQTVDGHAGSAVADGRAPAGMDAADVVKDIEANLIPDAVLIPAMVGEVSRAQQTGYTLVFVPAFRP